MSKTDSTQNTSSLAHHSNIKKSEDLNFGTHMCPQSFIFTLKLPFEKDSHLLFFVREIQEKLEEIENHGFSKITCCLVTLVV